MGFIVICGEVVKGKEKTEQLKEPSGEGKKERNKQTKKKEKKKEIKKKEERNK
jgi:hypothetical protein